MKMWRTRSPPLVKLCFFAMGTEVSVTLSVGNRRRRDEAPEAIADVERLLQDFGRRAWAWGDGALSRFNAALASGVAAEIPAGLKPLFTSAWAMQQASGGRYEPRIATLVQLWGFHDMARLRSEPPPAVDIERALAALQFAPPYDGGDAYGPAPGVGWDFGGIGKGWIVDRALELLQEAGWPDAIVDAGGNLAVRGGRGDRPWRIGIRDPHSDAEAPLLLASLIARDEAVNTHGDDQRYFEFEGQRYAHLLDPHNGRPARGLRSLTVVHADGALAEAAGAAMFVAGREGWRGLARELGLTQVLAVTEDGAVQATAALAARLRAEQGLPIQIVS